jgi:hypothetical protein
MNSLDIEIDETTLKKLVRNYLADVLSTPITEADIKIETKSKQNYRSEWEVASFRAMVHQQIT